MCLGLSPSQWAEAMRQMNAKGITLEGVNKPDTVEPQQHEVSSTPEVTIYFVGAVIISVDLVAEGEDLTEYVKMDLEPIEAPSVFIAGFHDKIQVPEVTGREVSSLGLMSPAVKPVASRDSPHRYRGPARFA